MPSIKIQTMLKFYYPMLKHQFLLYVFIIYLAIGIWFLVFI